MQPGGFDNFYTLSTNEFEDLAERQQASFRASLSSSFSLLTIEDLPVDAELPPHLLHQDMIMLAAKDDEKLLTFVSS